MKKNLLSIILTICFGFLLGFQEVIAQDRKLQKAEKSYDHYNFIDAREIYLKIVEKGYSSEEVLTKLANTYYFNAEYKKAVEWYKRTFEEIEDTENPML